MNKVHWIALAVIGLALGFTQTGLSKRTVEEVACRVELDREVLPAGTTQKAVVKVTLDAPSPPKEKDRPPVNLCIVLDRSGSMSGSKIEKAKEAAIEALRRLGEQDLFSLVIYDHNVETIVPAQSASRTEWIEGRIRGIRSGGNTALFGGVSQGAAEIRKNLERKKFVHRIILLSDGLANVGPSSPQDLARLGAALVKEDIAVSTVGVGTDYNEDLMTRLSQSSDGNSYFVESSVDLPRIFAAELGDVLSVVARKVILEIDCPEGTRPIRIIGRDGRIRDNRVEIQLNQLYGGQEKYALIEIEVAPSEPDEVREVAVARCSYQSAVTLKHNISSAKVETRFSRDRNEVVKSANNDVQKEFFYNEAAITKDRAVDLWDQGKKDEAVEELRKNSQKLQEIGREYNLAPSVMQAAGELDQEAQSLEQEGMSKSKRKEYRTDSYQIRNQQMNQ